MEPARAGQELRALLAAYGQGRAEAGARLLTLLYDDLRALARSHFAREAPGHSLEPTALVHEAWLRLQDGEGLAFQNRHAFFGLASRVMRSLLVDHARAKQADKRGAGATRVTLGAVEGAGSSADRSFDVLVVDEALERLQQANPELAALVELRFFAGLTLPEAAEALGLSPRTADRRWRVASAWLRRALSD